ncbi:D-psicose/D-tagatose/L-ribulose 3-epimerase [Pseudomonas sp. EB276 TE3739]|uniref:sugar phosphate isomerase/epimerase family protein n=1 Tax=Pseudomonas TaxID=286 RepID=UPI00209F1F27|nr:TIM barrel protein [Pseudomonas koreensis]MCP1477240.1 sugar phosphate isomerase/epimerase [Pseudomonas koreensis]
MRLALSNISWDISEDAAIAKLLQRYAINAIDIAPGKYFPDPVRSKPQEIADTRNWWRDQGIEITGMQSLLFGTIGLNVFGSTQSQAALLQHLSGVSRIAQQLGSRRLVFGSPKNRDRTGLSDEQTLDMAVTFFQKLGNIAFANDVIYCLEPNPVCYGANFMTTSPETAEVVRRVNHPAIKMQFDTGSLAINGEDPQLILDEFASLIGHVHASEPNLVPLGDGSTEHSKMSIALEQHLPGHVVSIEMVATRNEPHLRSIERALQVAIKHYRNGDQGATV